jgi:hypothetical protein
VKEGITGTALSILHRICYIFRDKDNGKLNGKENSGLFN